MSQPDVQVFQIGERLGDYQVVGLLGFGGMGVVYRVRNVISEREEAMKVLLPDVRNAPELAERFMREIKIQARLTHPGIAALYTALSSDHRLIMMMELVEGSSLAERLHQGPLAPGEVRDIGCQVLAALGYAHSMGVVHRDIKPANIMVTPGGVAKLMDFGVAKAAREQSLTQAGTALGSYAYMSPEQVLGQATDARSDLYSLGVTLYETLAGRHPLSGASEHVSVTAHLQKAPVPLVGLVPGLPSRFSEIILKALEKEPRNRFQTAAEFRAALESASPGAGRASTPRVTPGHLDSATLAKVEKCLSAALGPIARQVLTRASGRHLSMEALCQDLGGEISAQADRDAFLRCCAASTGGSAAMASTAGVPTAIISQTPTRITWDPALLDRAKRELARYIGPMAQMIVERAAREAHCPKQLWEALAAEISDPADRESFWAAGGNLG
jgi:eukaryotic-like serine/threonine-protein kinase